MLILTEKPSVAKTFAEILKCSYVNGYYKSNTCEITYCVGHLYQLKSPEQYDEKYKKWNLDTLPIIPKKFEYEINHITAKQEKIVSMLLRKHRNDTVIIATDAGREGEIIARETLLMAGITDIGKIKRFWVSQALTEEIIVQGMNEAKPLTEYNAYAEQGFGRQKADWLIGINISRLISLYANKPLAIGRVKAAVLSAIQTRNNEVKQFIPEKYNEIEITITDMSESVRGKLLNENEKADFPNTNKIFDEVCSTINTNTPISVDRITKEEKTQYAEKLFNITGLQKEAYKRFELQPDTTLQIAQKLYEEYKCLSYPRTPSKVLGESNIDLAKTIHNTLKNYYSRYSDGSESTNIHVNNKRVFNNEEIEDHHALIPLALPPKNLQENEKRVFELVVERFFMVFKPPYRYIVYKAYLLCSGYKFISQIKKIVNQGWKENEDNNSEQILNNPDIFFQKQLTASNPVLLQKETQPKKEFTMDTLLAFMENPHKDEKKKLVGLGTAATRAEIIKDISNRNYIEFKKKNIYLSDAGLFLISQIISNKQLQSLADIDNTTKWESQLTVSTDKFLETTVMFIENACKISSISTFSQDSELGKCPKCGGEILEGQKNFYCSQYKVCNFILWKNTYGTTITKNDVKKILENKTIVKKCTSKAGSQYTGKLSLNKEFSLELITNGNYNVR